MDKDRIELSSRIRRLPVKQGLRSLLGDQDRDEEFATGKLQNVSEKVEITPIQLRKKLRIGTWNVRSMLSTGKTLMIGNELERLHISICGLSEVRWEGQGHFKTTAGHTIVYSGAEKRGQKGVAIWLHRKIGDSLIGYDPISDRVLMVRIKAKPRCITIIQVYSPTMAAEEENLDQFYESLSTAVDRAKKKDLLMVIGDFNAKVGKREIDSMDMVTGPWGLGKRNDSGERLVDFCEDHSLMLMNTWFKQHHRRLYTWVSPDGTTRNQIDYIAMHSRWKASVLNCKTYPGADCDTDHQLLVATLRINLAKYRLCEHVRRLNLEELKEEKATVYATAIQNRFAILESVEEARSPNELWQETKAVLLEEAKNTVGFQKKVKRQNWITNETLALIQAKREAKSKDVNKYAELKTQVRKAVRKDKEKELDQLCTELEEAHIKGNMRPLFRIAKQLSQKFNPQVHCINSTSGEHIIEKEKIAERWKEYCEELYDNTDTNTPDKEKLNMDKLAEREPPPLQSEVEWAMRNTANGKSPGPDEVPAELFKKGGETALHRMHKICVALWETGEWPDEWTDSIFIPIPKKGDMKQCTNYRTIALVSHASKIILRIILERIRTKTESELAEEQAGFRRGRGTRDQITNLRILMQKAKEHQQPIYMCFVDFRKAFDSIHHEKLWITMLDMGYPIHLVTLLSNLYKNQRARVKAANTLSQSFRIKKGVRQGCVLSPYLFNILAEIVMRETLEGFSGGIQIGGRRITNLRYADDIVLLASTEAELQLLLNRLDTAARIQGLFINFDKTHTMSTDGTKCNIFLQGNLLTQVEAFTYLGAIITSDARCEKEVKSRLAKARAANVSLTKIWKNHGISLTVKIRLWKALVWPIATYGCESWTLAKKDETRIEAFEMKGLRKILRVPWIAKRTNEWVMKKAEYQKILLGTVKRRKLTYFGHMVRKQGDCLEKEIMQGTIPGKRAQGRPRITWFDNIRTWTGLTTYQATRATNNRQQWKRIVHSVTNPRNEEG